MTNTDVTKKYRALSDVEHVLLRPGRYIGSITPKTAVQWLYDEATEKMVQRECTWNSGFLKMFDEIISNSVDHSKTPEGRHLDTVKVEIDRTTGTISVADNGGIPVVMHPELGVYIPTMLFGMLRAGSNFNDDETDAAEDLTGQNGEGASLTNIFSTSFTVETCDGAQRFKQTWTNNMMTRGKETLLPGGTKGTKITWTADYAHLKTELNDDNYAKLVKRVVDVAGCNPKLKIFLNGKRITIKSFQDYVALYTETFEFDENPDWQIAFAASDDGFQQVSFVNSTETLQGGTHVYYVWYQVALALKEFISKKYKVELKPTDIQPHLRVFINARIARPRYDSQTKENLMTEAKDFKTSWKVSDKFIQRLVKSTIIERIMIWVEAKAKAAELQAMKQLNKTTEKFNPKRLEKLQDANLAGKEPEKCILFLTEGDSAAKAGKSTGDRATMGWLALRGKPLNVTSIEAADLLKRIQAKADAKKNDEFQSFMIAMGLQIGVKVTSIKQLRYGKVAFTTDADVDGSHIKGLLCSNIHRFWPELFELGVIHVFKTPLIKVTAGKTKLQFMNEPEFQAWREKNPTVKFEMKYYKGLGTNEDHEFKEYLTNVDKHLVRLEIKTKEDSDVIGLVFGKSYGAADRRKTWLKLTDESMDDAEVTVD